jgi:hypothetical protein
MSKSDSQYLTLGFVVASFGAGMQWGPGAGLIVVGMGIFVLTVAEMVNRR